MVMVFGFRKADKESVPVRIMGAVKQDWTPTGNIDFRALTLELSSPQPIRLWVEEKRITETVVGQRVEELRWRFATIEEGKHLVICWNARHSASAFRGRHASELDHIAESDHTALHAKMLPLSATHWGEVGMAKVGRVRLFLVLSVPIALLAVLLVTAEYHDDGHGVHYIGRPPFVSVSWEPSDRDIGQRGINVAWDSLGAPGNVVEFPITPQTRISVRLFSVYWFRQEFRAWVSNHKTIARWMRLDRWCRQFSIRRVSAA
jgi:hypothetical protein